MFKIKCSQRGCQSTSSGDKAPKLCPVCANPLLKGDAVEVKKKPDAPVSTGGTSDPNNEGSDPS